MAQQVHRLPRRNLVISQTRGNVELPPLGPVEGEVQRREGQHGAHDIVALQAHGGHGVSPEILQEAVVGEGRVRGGGVVKEELEVERVEVVGARGRCGGEAYGLGGGEEVAADVVLGAVSA